MKKFFIFVPVQQYKPEVGSPPRGARSGYAKPHAQQQLARDLEVARSGYAKPHAQQQLARDLEVERAAMGQRCRPQSFGEVQRCNPQPRRWLDFL